MSLKRSALSVGLLVSLSWTLSGCGTRAHQTYLDPTYQSKARTQVVRVEVVTASADTTPMSAQSDEGEAWTQVLAMWGLMAQRYLNDQRDFLALSRRVDTEGVSRAPAQSEGRDAKIEATLNNLAQTPCAEGLSGRILIVGRALKEGAEARIQLSARLTRCPEPIEGSKDVSVANTLVWSAHVEHSSESADAVLVTLRERYVKQFGASVAPYAAPSFLAIKALFDLSPYPQITNEDDVMEKIDLEY